jgi:hypothetical protein
VTEAAWQEQVTQLAGLCGWRVLHVRKSLGRRNGGRAWQTTTNVKGWPDLYCWKRGRTLAVELKSEDGKTSPEQREVLASLSEAGVEVYVWRPSDLEEAKRVLSRRAA